MYFCQLFLFSIKWSRQCCEDKYFSSSRSGFENLCRAISFYDFTDICQIPIVTMTQWVEQQGSEALVTGSNPSLSPTFFKFINTMKIVISPLLCMKIFDTRVLLKPGRVPLRNFSILWDKKFEGKSWYPPLLSIKFFDTRNFLKQKGSPTIFFGSVRQKFFNRKSWYPSLLHKI